MGTWGHGNFENDTVADHYCDLCKPLIEQIRSTVEDEDAMDPDEYDSEVMMANIEILAILAENVGRTEKGSVGDVVFPFPFPEPSEIMEWRTKYLAVWDGYIDQLEPDPDYKVNRRATIVSTFDRFIKVSESGS